MLTDTCTHTHAHTPTHINGLVGLFPESERDKMWKKGKKDIELISHPINVTEDTQHIFFQPAGTPEDSGK